MTILGCLVSPKLHNRPIIDGNDRHSELPADLTQMKRNIEETEAERANKTALSFYGFSFFDVCSKLF